MARHLWPGENPIGRRFIVWYDEKFFREVVGVVGDTKTALDKEAEFQMYGPLAQDPNWGCRKKYLIVLTDGANTYGVEDWPDGAGNKSTYAAWEAKKPEWMLDFVSLVRTQLDKAKAPPAIPTWASARSGSAIRVRRRSRSGVGCSPRPRSG